MDGCERRSLFLFGFVVVIVVLFDFPLGCKGVRQKKLPTLSHVAQEWNNIDDDKKEHAATQLSQFTVQNLKHLHVDSDGNFYFADGAYDADDPWENVHKDELNKKKKRENIEKRDFQEKADVEHINAVANIPVLHSYLGAADVIYLDFDGEYYTAGSTIWPENQGIAINAAPFDRDGNTAYMNAEEQQIITQTWRKVSEDYSPWLVDVTTERPATFTAKTSHAVITLSVQGMPAQNAGGVAYVGVHGSYGSQRPAWVYYNHLGNPSNIGECVSHEIGHNMGLQHDGYYGNAYYGGGGVWAPIMGAAYDMSITQFSRGTYPGANQFEDDIAIVSTRLPLAPVQLRPYNYNNCLRVNTLLQPKTRSVTISFDSLNSQKVTVTASGIGNREGNVDTSLVVVCNGYTVGQDAPQQSVSSTVSFTGTGSSCTATITSSGDSSNNPVYTDYGSIGQLIVDFCNAQNLAFGNAPTTNQPQPPPPPTPTTPTRTVGYCCFYLEPDYWGVYWCMNISQRVPDLPSLGLGSQVSSLYCVGAQAYFYQNINFGGAAYSSGCNGEFTRLGALDNWISSCEVVSCTSSAKTATGSGVVSVLSDEEVETQTSNTNTTAAIAGSVVGCIVVIVIVAVVVGVVRAKRTAETA